MANRTRVTKGTSRYGGSAVEQANQAALKREDEIRGLFDKIIGTYEPGGDFGAGTEAMIDRQKKQYTGQATQQLISSGLYGSTMTAGIPKKFEEEIGMPTRLKLEDIRKQAYTGALGQKASFIERIEDVTPSFETLAQLTAQAQQPTQSLSSWLGETFGGGGSGYTSPKTSTGGGMSAAEIQAAKLKRVLDDYKAPETQYNSLYGKAQPEQSIYWTDAEKKKRLTQEVQKNTSPTSYVPTYGSFGI